ncbi:MAG: imidazole glycerol phosphate synthase subunit HisF [Deltaproteobacteria bacterium RBG_16_71_12]|nr:MAG: imidazole glycerol phosphate synthase subunit HisF [Deltaproteobacteria bacterium RBG_16_71_12]
MLRPRIIPCLLVHDQGLVKTVKFQEGKYVGDPLNAVKIFNEKEVDELIVLDIDATVKGAVPNERLIGQLAVECRMPLSYGGGITSVEQARRIIGLGVEKVALSAAALADPSLVSRIADEVGSQSVVVVLDVKKQPFGGYQVFTHNGTRATKQHPVEAARQAQARGAGEIVVNAIDRDGAMKGYDLELAAQVRAAVSVPLTVLGGAGSQDDLAELFAACGVVGAAAGSLFVFKGPFRAVLINYPTQAQRDQLVAAALSRRPTRG